VYEHTVSPAGVEQTGPYLQLTRPAGRLPEHKNIKPTRVQVGDQPRPVLPLLGREPTRGAVVVDVDLDNRPTVLGASVAVLDILLGDRPAATLVEADPVVDPGSENHRANMSQRLVHPAQLLGGCHPGPRAGGHV